MDSSQEGCLTIATKILRVCLLSYPLPFTLLRRVLIVFAFLQFLLFCPSRVVALCMADTFLLLYQAI